ncbi:MAG TPA: hypothetical protein VGD71_43345 [Kribbella sp.]
MSDVMHFSGLSCQCPHLFICTGQALAWNRLAAGRYLRTERWQHGPQDLYPPHASHAAGSRQKLDVSELLTWHVDLPLGYQDPL